MVKRKKKTINGTVILEIIYYVEMKNGNIFSKVTNFEKNINVIVFVEQKVCRQISCATSLQWP